MQNKLLQRVVAFYSVTNRPLMAVYRVFARHGEPAGTTRV